jgi:hypothetical protein
MIFSLTAIDEDRQIRHFSFRLHDLEASLTFLEEIAASSHALLRVQVIDRQQVSDLPLETFYGMSAATALKQLETEWKSILADESAASLPSKPEEDQCIQELIDYLEIQIVSREVGITELEERIQASLMPTEAKGLVLHSDTVSASYKIVLKGYYREITKFRSIRARLLTKLEALSAG